MGRNLIAFCSLIVVLTGATGGAQEPRGDGQTIVVPRDAPTIQAAVDAVPDGGTVIVGPSRYEETVWVRRKSIHIRGIDRPQWVGPIPDRVMEPERAVGLVNYVDGAGGSLSGFNFIGGDVAIAGFDRAAPPGELTVRDVNVQRSGRGILWSTGPLNARSVLVTGTLWHGISLWQAPQIDFGALQISNNLGVGIIRVDSGCNCFHEVCRIKDSFVNDNLLGGILAIRSGLCIDHTFMMGNSIFGLQAVGSAIRLSHFAVSNTKQRFDGHYGDGIVAMPDAAPSHMSVSAGYVYGSARAGISNLGSSVALRNNLVSCSGFDLESETVPADFYGPGKPATTLFHVYDNEGGNFCGCPGAVGACVAQSAALQPPAPLPGN